MRRRERAKVMKRKRRKRLKPSSIRPAGHGVQAPVLAIVGRPNVGKSALFNRLVGRKVSIVEPTAGVTRDRIAALVELDRGRVVELVDTGGLGGSADTLASDVDRQIAIALEMADAVLLVVDGRDGLTPMDKAIARRVGKLHKPTLLCVNKVETPALENAAHEFWELGLGEPMVVSAMQGDGRGELVERLTDLMPERDEPELGEAAAGEGDAPREMRLAIVGRRNVGKSTYVNALFGSERVLVSSMPGTTRDSIDVRVEVGAGAFTLIDTAGLRRRGRADDAIEMLAHLRARESVARSDVTLLFLSAGEKISLVDKHLARLIAEEYKTCVIVGTKWDEVEGAMSLEAFADYVRKKLPGMAYAPVVLLSSHGELNVAGPVEAARELYRQSLVRAPTNKINRAVRAAYERKRPRVRRNILPRIYFATQIRTNPVTLVLFCNKPSLFSAAYRRYLANQLRGALPFPEVPIKFLFRERVNIFERGIHHRIRRLKSLDDARWVDARGKEEAPADGEENVSDLFEVLFGERAPQANEGAEDYLDWAEEHRELVSGSRDDDRVPAGFVDEGEHVFDETSEAGGEDDDEDAGAGEPEHPLGGGGA